VEARGEGVVLAILDPDHAGDGVFPLHLQAQTRWSLDDHRSMPFIGDFEEFISGGRKPATIALPLPLLVEW
jgi:hypothetical protein